MAGNRILLGPVPHKDAHQTTEPLSAICPLPVNAFCKERSCKVGGCKNSYITEYVDARLKVADSGYKISYAHGAIAYTKAPATRQELQRQRLRRLGDYMQTFRLHRDPFFLPGCAMLWLL